MSAEIPQANYLAEKARQREIARDPLGQIRKANQLLQAIQDRQERQREAQKISKSLIYLPWYSSYSREPYPFSICLSRRSVTSSMPPGCVSLEANKDYLGGRGDAGMRYLMVRREANPPDLIEYFSSEEARQQLSLFASFLFNKDESEISLFLGDEDIRTNLEKYLDPINPLKSGPLISLEDKGDTLSISVDYLKMGIPLGETESFEVDVSELNPRELERQILKIEGKARKEYMRRLQTEYASFYRSCPKEELPPLNNAEANLIRKIDFSGKDVLEIGPGMGIFAGHLQEIVKSLDVVELSKEARRFLTKKIHDGVYESCAQVRNYNWQKKYDFIIAEGVIEETCDPTRVIEEWVSLLKAGGSLFITWPADNDSLLPLVEGTKLVVRERIDAKGSSYSFYRLSWPEPTLRRTRNPTEIWGWDID